MNVVSLVGRGLVQREFEVGEPLLSGRTDVFITVVQMACFVRIDGWRKTDGITKVPISKRDRRDVLTGVEIDSAGTRTKGIGCRTPNTTI